MAGLILVLMFFQYESPRFLVKQGKPEKAAKVLSYIRHQAVDSDYVVGETAIIQAALDHEMEATRGVGFFGMVKEMFLDTSNLYRVYLATMVQLLSQWSGAGSITLYANDLFALVGITGKQEGLLVTAVFGIVKLISAMACALFLVDVIGRKRSLLLGITLQSISMIYVASFLTSVPQLGVVKGYEVPGKDVAASRGAIAMVSNHPYHLKAASKSVKINRKKKIYLSGAGWALGWNSMQYLLTAELFPLRIRALATSWAMTLHFANQYGNTRALPNMLLSVSNGGISPKGTFWCFAAITIVGGAWVLVSVPETSGRSLESMDRLFDLSWYKIGLYGNRDAELQDEAYNEKEQTAHEMHGMGQHVESTGQHVEEKPRTIGV